AAAPASIAAPRTPAVAESLVVLETPLYRATFSNLGARLRSFELKRYAASWGESRYADHASRRPRRGDEVPAGDRVELSGQPAFAFDLGSGTGLRSLGTLPYAVAESTGANGAVVALTFTARDSGLEVRQSWRTRPDTYLLDVDVAVS